MTTSLDTTTLTLLEEHVRRLLHSMGFALVTVRCRVVAAPDTPREPAADEALFRNAALEALPVPRTATASNRARLMIEIEAGEEGRLLIGVQGAHLEALQHVLRSLLRQHLQAPVHITVDVNGYRLRREEGIIQLAQEAARQVTASGRAVALKPMGASDRRTVHTALADRRDVKTESQGVDPRRHVVIRPVS